MSEYVVKQGIREDGTPYIETVGDYNPKVGRRPEWKLGEDYELYKQQLAIRRAWEVAAGLLDPKTGTNLVPYIDGKPEYIPNYVEIVYHPVSDDALLEEMILSYDSPNPTREDRLTREALKMLRDVLKVRWTTK